jgi:hypothetical protein
LPPLEAWEKVFVGDEFMASVCNVQNCIGCHGGVEGVDDKDAAHEGRVRDPLEDSERVCGICHAETTRLAATSLHQNLTGYRTILTARGADFSDPRMGEAFNNHCDSCHTTCGQCHISRPTAMDGGLLKEHEVKEVASMKDTCMACHGARVSNEYQGKNEGVEGSVHWLEEGMPCFECHNVSDYHGDGTEYAHRYDGPPDVSCLDLDCHSEVALGQGEVVEQDIQADKVEKHIEHDIHADKVACEVCHVSGPYKNCYNCHVAIDEEGLPYYETDDSQMTFKIGRNPLKSDDRPWDYVLVRHIPVVPDTFAFYGDNLLSTFNNVPTWKYATPHNIQRVTAQNESCDSCHGNADLFLTADDVAPEELEANAAVIVEEIPPTSWGPYSVIEPTPVPARWLWLLWVGLAVVAVAVVVVAVVLVTRRAKAG